MEFYKGKKVLVTGGAGFIGTRIVESLLGYGASVTVVDNLEAGSRENLVPYEKDINFLELDLRSLDSAEKAARGQEVVINLASKVAGIEYNRLHHAEMYTGTAQVAVNMMDAAVRAGVERFLVVSSACIYRGEATVPTPEHEGYDEGPETNNEGYGWAKRMAEIQGKYFHDEGKIKVAMVRPFNVYGPNDHFEERISHVIPAIIKRVIDGENPIICWGSGNQTRSFIHVRDIATAFLAVTAKYAEGMPVNVGTDEEISMGDLTRLIMELAGVNADIFFDTSKPEGYIRRQADISLLKSSTGFTPAIKLRQGLAESIEYYRSIVAKK